MCDTLTYRPTCFCCSVFHVLLQVHLAIKLNTKVWMRICFSLLLPTKCNWLDWWITFCADFFKMEHLDGLKDICHIFCQCSNCFRFFWSESTCSVVEADEYTYTLQSSANNCVVFCSLSGKSLMYSRNSGRPNTVACWTPDNSLCSWEATPSHTTVWVWVVKI